MAFGPSWYRRPDSEKDAAVERSFLRKKVNYCLEAMGPGAQGCGSSAALSSPCASVDAWAADEKRDFRTVIQEWVRESEVKAA